MRQRLSLIESIKSDSPYQIKNSQWRSLKNYSGAPLPKAETLQVLDGLSRVYFPSFPGEYCRGTVTTVTLNGNSKSKENWSCPPGFNRYSFAAVSDSQVFINGKSFSLGTQFEDKTLEFNSAEEAKAALIKKFTDSFPSCEELRNKLPKFGTIKPKPIEDVVKTVDLKVNDSGKNLIKEKEANVIETPVDINKAISK